jgi:outer membrane receptor protein involved in Fe transport
MRLALTFLFCLLALPDVSAAGDLTGRVTDRTGGVLPGAIVRLLNVATGEELSVPADAQGRYRFSDLLPGAYRVAVGFAGFSEASRSIVIEARDASATLDFVLELGTQRSDVTVAAARGARDTAVVPLRVDTYSGAALRQLVPASTGDALLQAPGITPVGSGPFQIRPRLRGLDSTRVLVLVDGERLNNARTATDRAGIEVGLISPDAIDAIEVLGGAGSVLYGTDALAGTINIITNQPRLSDVPLFTAGFDGLYSSNDRGRRGTVRVGLSNRRFAVSFVGGVDEFDEYRAGGGFRESSAALFADGTLVRDDTIDTNFGAFGFDFGAFPDPFNAPFTRTSNVVPRSGMEGSSINLAAIAMITPSQELQVRYQRREASDIGFPDFEQPFFFQTIALPFSNLDKLSASYAVRDLTPWLRKVSATAYYQRQDRLLRNEFPVQFPAPTPRDFFPINVFRLDIESDTRQQVWTPGVDVQANMQVRPDNVLTAGVSMFRDRSEDERTTATQMSLLGAVQLGARGPAPIVFPTPVPLGPPAIEHPVRVPDATFRNVGVYVQDEWDVTPALRLTGGLRLDRYRVATTPTPGYDIETLVSGADPAIDPATLPDVDGDRISRTALTGEAGVVLWAARPVSVFAHYVRSYRHPNLEELLFSGPATAGNIVPNVRVEPETGNNVDAGVRFRLPRLTGSAAYFNNTYDGFISTEIVASSPEGSISQAINLAKVRIQGVETQMDAPLVGGPLVVSPFAALAITRGTVLEGVSPLTGKSIAGQPQDNISPWKLQTGVRVSDRRERVWGAYSVRAQGDVTRVSPLLSESPFLIAQDLLALEGFTVHRLAAGYDWRTGGQRLGLTVAVDNLTDAFYREHFQFAPARGRSVTVGLSVGGSR